MERGDWIFLKGVAVGMIVPWVIKKILEDIVKVVIKSQKKEETK